MTSQLVEAWRMANEVNLYLLGQLPKDGLDARYSTRTRSVREQFVHLHSVRVRWLKYSAPDLSRNLTTFVRGARPTAASLAKALRASEKVIARFLERCEEKGAVRGWNGPPATFLGYLVAHEAHHRGLAMVALRAAGHKLPKEVVYGQWDWGKKQSHR